MNNRDFEIRQRGKLGERYVCDYLENKGYNIIQTNYSSRYGEIDIIAENETIIAFVEVKTRTKKSLTGGFESVTKSKIAKFTKTAVIYMTKNNVLKQPRIDCAQVIVSEKDNRLVEISYAENSVVQWDGYSAF